MEGAVRSTGWRLWLYHISLNYIHTFWNISNMYPKSFPTTWKLNWFCHQNYWSNNDKLIKQVLTINYARDPKQCARRIVWNNGEKLKCCKGKKEIPGQILQVPFPFAKISVEDRVQDLLDRFCVEAAVRDALAGLFVQGVYKISPPKISARDFKVRSLFKLSMKISEQDFCSLHRVSAQDLCKRSGKIFVSKQHLPARSLTETFMLPIRGLLAKSLEEIPAQALSKSSLGKISVRDLSDPFGKISAQDLYKRSLRKISKRGLRGKVLRKLSIQDILAKISA